MDPVEIIGFIAGILTTSSFLPQLIKIYTHKSARDISLFMYIIISTGIFLWLIYGIEIKSMPIIGANGVSLALTLLILVGKLRFDQVSIP
ncbi:MAG: SemiSWEET transporter [Thermoplasmata archaeon]|jgi:MtN3 and saliva related transmembrane protein|nr:SemiSWEET transporter [Thermoplasmata archaeon]MVT13652.1 hypothetical protein [Euryarchaeota archaeon]MVT14618.1 hypothetical protein [Euryarchaeota archaeon]MVT35575.1 hypothetical protein [Euryarchaeota archaeon]